MDATTVTLSLPTELVHNLEQIAAERQVPLDTLVAEALAQLVQSDEDYEAAKADYFSIIAKNINAGNDGKPLGPRDELYKRE